MTLITQLDALAVAVGTDIKAITAAISGAQDSTQPARAQLAALGDILVIETGTTLVVAETMRELLQIPDTVELLEIAAQGPAGPPGPQGIPGDAAYVGDPLAYYILAKA